MNRGVYAIQTDAKGKPTNLIRVSKKRALKGKARKKARQAVRAQVKMTIAQKEIERGDDSVRRDVAALEREIREIRELRRRIQSLEERLPNG